MVGITAEAYTRVTTNFIGMQGCVVCESSVLDTAPAVTLLVDRSLPMASDLPIESNARRRNSNGCHPRYVSASR